MIKYSEKAKKFQERIDPIIQFLLVPDVIGCNFCVYHPSEKQQVWEQDKPESEKDWQYPGDDCFGSFYDNRSNTIFYFHYDLFTDEKIVYSLAHELTHYSLQKSSFIEKVLDHFFEKTLKQNGYSIDDLRENVKIYEEMHDEVPEEVLANEFGRGYVELYKQHKEKEGK